MLPNDLCGKNNLIAKKCQIKYAPKYLENQKKAPICNLDI